MELADTRSPGYVQAVSCFIFMYVFNSQFPPRFPVLYFKTYLGFPTRLRLLDFTDPRSCFLFGLVGRLWMDM